MTKPEGVPAAARTAVPRDGIGWLGQVSRVDSFTVDDGPARGTRLMRLVNGGALEIEVLPDRFAGGWGVRRAAVYRIEKDKLGEFYAKGTILKREVLPGHVANAVFALTCGDLTHTTGLHIPVDAGVAAAFLR
nr:hypothetical protein [Catenulispora rubra]